MKRRPTRVTGTGNSPWRAISYALVRPMPRTAPAVTMSVVVPSARTASTVQVARFTRPPSGRVGTAQAEIVRTDLAAVRTILDHAITAAQEHDLLHRALSDVFDALTATANTYLDGPLDTLTPAAAPTD